MNKIAITTGDPNGIGAEITIKALRFLDLPTDKIVLISNKKILDFYGKLDKDYEIIEIPYDAEIIPGKVTKEAGEFSFQCLKKVCEIQPQAIVTAPVAKNALHLAGHKFNGQTEILQHYLARDNQLAEMLFVAKGFKVLLLTRHCALKDVNLTKDIVVEKVKNLVKTFQSQFWVENPKFALCAFNPHAGEDGILGNEEIEILTPAVTELQGQGINITAPLPADTLFVKAAKCYYENTQDEYDCYIANYHDQGLIPIKTVAGDKTVNMTIGLDIIRTSPGHGTAFDIAGKNIADPAGMIEAIKSTNLA
ncbi:MAG: 4-hydroxythreonine-4-phosphate dehydrogenase PdxA [Muribaculaceae bacterium]|nr:4-hydroxythreonine-4-phosphate dehydrogenase PdxA [Muribaculaceae bacterium]